MATIILSVKVSVIFLYSKEFSMQKILMVTMTGALSISLLSYADHEGVGLRQFSKHLTKESALTTPYKTGKIIGEAVLFTWGLTELIKVLTNHYTYQSHLDSKSLAESEHHSIHYHPIFHHHPIKGNGPVVMLHNMLSGLINSKGGNGATAIAAMLFAGKHLKNDLGY